LLASTTSRSIGRKVVSTVLLPEEEESNVTLGGMENRVNVMADSRVRDAFESLVRRKRDKV
jgi:hypothetical protein